MSPTIGVLVVGLIAASNYLAYRLGAAMARTRRSRKDMKSALTQWRIFFKIFRGQAAQLARYVALAFGLAALAVVVLLVRR